MTDNRATLPRQLQDQLQKCDQIRRDIERHNCTQPKRGPEPKQKRIPVIMFLADTERELDRKLHAHAKAVGPKARGNKRIGKRDLYSELITYYFLLDQHGITLPRNKSLSKKSCAFGLGEILRRHGCTELTDNLLIKSGMARKKIAAKMDRVFSRIAHAVDNTPA